MKSGSNLEKVLSNGDFAVTVEIGPPMDCNAEVVVNKARMLKGYADAFNITDNQTAVVRLSSIASAILIMREGLEPVIQMTCGDGNRLAIQSDILGAAALGVKNCLCIAGDHQSFGAAGKLKGHPGAKNVYDVDSIQLVSILKGLRDEKLNCWDYLKCDYGPESSRPCPAAVDETSDGVNGGLNAGRICWSVKNTRCFNMKMGSFIEKKKICFTCGFFHRVKKEEGEKFQMFKLAQGIKNPSTLHSMLSLIEDMMKIHDRLNSQFDLYTTIRDITSEARKVTWARRSIVFLVKGNPPALYGDFRLRGKDVHVKIEINDDSIVGFAANHKQTVNYAREGLRADTDLQKLFNRSFDEQCNCNTNSLLAVPVFDSENRILGVITAVNAKKGYFSPDDE